MSPILKMGTLLTLILISMSGFTQSTPIRTGMVVYHTANGDTVEGFLAYPEDQHDLPAVLLIHEWWGLNDDIKAKATMFAEEGYLALAVDLYHGEHTTDPSVARKLATSVRNDMNAAFENLNSAISFLKKTGKIDSNRIASIGWCFGGGWSYQMAKNNLGTKVSVIYYGFFNPEDDLSKMRADILGHFAEKDRAIKVDDVIQFQAKLKTLSGDHEIYIYPNTTHGFASRPNANPNYNKEAAEVAWERTLKFLKNNL